MIEVVRPGLLTTIQDRGRRGYRRYGVPLAGALDSVSLRIANLLVGNDEWRGALEMTLLGPELRITRDTVIALSGADLDGRIEGVAIPLHRPVLVRSGNLLRFGEARSGCRGYMAVAGGCRLPSVLGSQSTDIRARLGGLHGRALAAGDLLPLDTDGDEDQVDMALAALTLSGWSSPSWFADPIVPIIASGETTVHAIAGSEFARLTQESSERVFGESFRLSPRSDRMGCRLDGATLALSGEPDMESVGVVPGTVQVPPDGHPIVLLADCGTTGGYPAVAHVVTADLPKLAQRRPGDAIRFRPCGIEQARDLLADQERLIDALRAGIAMKLR